MAADAGKVSRLQWLVERGADAAEVLASDGSALLGYRQLESLSTGRWLHKWQRHVDEKMQSWLQDSLKTHESGAELVEALSAVHAAQSISETKQPMKENKTF